MKYSRRWRLHIAEAKTLNHDSGQKWVIWAHILSKYILSNKNLFPPPLVTSRAVREVNSETEKFAQSEEQRFVSYHLNHLCSAPGNLIRKVKKWKSIRISLQSANTPNSFPNIWFHCLWLKREECVVVVEQLLTLWKLLNGQKTTSFCCVFDPFLPIF